MQGYDWSSRLEDWEQKLCLGLDECITKICSR